MAHNTAQHWFPAKPEPWQSHTIAAKQLIGQQLTDVSPTHFAGCTFALPLYQGGQRQRKHSIVQTQKEAADNRRTSWQKHKHSKTAATYNAARLEREKHNHCFTHACLCPPFQSRLWQSRLQYARAMHR